MNPQEANVFALLVQAEAIKTDVIAMQAEDKHNGGSYTEQAYLDKAQALYAIANEIQQIARSGFLN